MVPTSATLSGNAGQTGPGTRAGSGGTMHHWPIALPIGQPLPGVSEPVRAEVLTFGPSYEHDPEATPLVFLPGLIGTNEHWLHVVERVRDRFACTLFHPPLLKVGGDLASTVGWARITSEFVRSFVKRPAILIGSSFGGHVALRTAILAPDLVKGIVLTGSSGMGEKSIITDNTIRCTTDWCQRRISELYHDQSHVRESEIMRAFAELSDRSNARTMIRLSKSARRDHLTDELHLIKQPTLLVWGKQDIVTPPAAARAFNRGLSASRIVWFDACGHVPMVEQPAQFAAALSQFADELRAAPTAVHPGPRAA